MRSDPPVRAPAGRWPDLLLVGAAHAGTSLLREVLARHPDLWFSDPPEPHHFSAIRPSRRFAPSMPVVADEADYRALFAGAPAGAVAAEASTSYLWSPDAPMRIAQTIPDARIVILLRDPIERAWAHHRADRGGGAERRGFLRAVRDESTRPGRWGQDQVYLSAGFYADALERYRAAFPDPQLHVGFYETLVADPSAIAREVVAWLGRDPARLPEPPRPPMAPAGRASWWRALRAGPPPSVPDEPRIDDPIRRLLAEVYAPDVRRVSDLLGVIPPWSITPPL